MTVRIIIGLLLGLFKAVIFYYGLFGVWIVYVGKKGSAPVDSYTHIYKKMILALLLAMVHNTVYHSIYEAGDFTKEKSLLLLCATFSITAVSYVIIMAAGAVRLKKKKMYYNKKFYWLLPTVVFLVPMLYRFAALKG